MAGVVGFEPTVHGTKNRCLTTWLHPNGEALIKARGAVVQDPIWDFAGLFVRRLAVEQIVLWQAPAFVLDDAFQLGLGGCGHVTGPHRGSGWRGRGR